MEKRNTNVDIVRVFAFFMVLVVHTMLNNGYYLVPLKGPHMIIATFVRQFAMVCVPLFMILTGYLCCGKEFVINKKYLSKLLKVIVPFILVSFLTYFVLSAYNILNGKTLLSILLNMGATGYAWYIEMYIGLYLLMPLINSGWNNIKDKKQRQAIIIVMFALCCVTNFTTPFGYKINGFWSNTYPLLFYLTGMYLKEYGLQISRLTKIVVLVISTMLSWIMAITVFRENVMVTANHYHNPFCFILSVMVFDLLINAKTENMNARSKTLLSKIADITLPAYLVSYVTDIFVYKMYAMAYIPTVQERLIMAPILILISAICSLTCGKIIAVISNKILNIRRKKI